MMTTKPVAALTSTLDVIVALSLLMFVVSSHGQQCCRDIAWQPQCGSLASPDTFVGTAPIGQTLATSPWLADGWYLSVQELRVADGRPYDIALVRLNATAANIVGQSELVNHYGADGLSVFQSFATALRAGTTNVHWHFSNSTNGAVWIESVRLHRTISTEEKVSARLELYSARDDALLYQRQWLWDTSLASNAIVHSIPVDTVHGPVSHMRLSFWGSGYAALGQVRICQHCVSATPTASQTPSPSSQPTRSPSAPPTVGGACLTGAQGVCAAGVWQQNEAGSIVCVMSVLPSREICDGLDNDCDGSVDEDFQGRVVECGTGICYRSMPMCLPSGQLAQCVPGMPEAQERCDGLDNDCNGLVDDALPILQCGIGECARSTPSCINGTSVMCVPGIAQSEVCDGLDNDCDGVIDEQNVCQRPSYAIAQPVVAPLLRCVSDNGQGLCTAHWDLVATAVPLADLCSSSSTTSNGSGPLSAFAYTMQTDDNEALVDNLSLLLLSSTNGDSDGGGVYLDCQNSSGLLFSRALANGEMEQYFVGAARQDFDCATTLSLCVDSGSGRQQFAAADRFSPLCNNDDVMKAPPPTSSLSSSSTTTSTPATSVGVVVVPLVEGCVQRVDGYCTVVFGYQLFGDQQVIIDIGAATSSASTLPVVVNHVASNVDSIAPLTQEQPTRFYPGRVRRALVVRAECPTATLQQWWVTWQLGAMTAIASVNDLCLTSI